MALIIALFACSVSAVAQPDGKALFQSKCATCHHPLNDATGPALQGVDGRVPSKEWLYDWVNNSAKVIASGDKYANDVFNTWGKTAMTGFPELSHEDIDAIVVYVNSVKPAGPEPGPGDTTAAAPASDNTWLYSMITVVLLLLMIILWRVNSGLRRVAHEKEGIPVQKEIPFYRNKVFIAIALVLLFIGVGYTLVNGALGLGRQKGYMPEQPIFYSHKVHAGINQINCQYCHAGAEKSKHAMVPSTNVCMNCHKQIKEYTGADTYPLFTAEGEEVDGTAEIQKLYKHAGWDPATKTYKTDAEGNILATPIKWTKIHNLPDHVYFNHSQHVAVGKVACQRCHGPIQDMDEVKQFAPLTMGWCINCHRQTEVKFAENDYYSIYEKYHEEMKSGERTSVTVNDIGGTECQKCHY
ncbi:MAG: c-type cytochrome [Flavipsychrobacter sp.]